METSKERTVDGNASLDFGINNIKLGQICLQGEMTPERVDINAHKKNIYSYDEKTMTPDKLGGHDSPVGKFKSTAGMDGDFTPKKRS